MKRLRTIFTEFSAGEMAKNCGLRVAPCLGPSHRGTVHDAVALMARREVCRLRGPALTKDLARDCVPAGVLFALGDCPESIEFGPGAAQLAGGWDRFDLAESLSGTIYAGIRRYLACDGRGSMALMSERDLNSTMFAADDDSGSRSCFAVDLKRIGIDFARAAGRPLVRLEMG